MKLQHWFATALVGLLFASAAPAALKNIENAYEAVASNVVLPANDHGQVAVRECETCSAVRLDVNSQTSYQIGASSPAVSLAAFRAAAAEAGDRLIVVFYNLDSKVVTRIVLGTAH